MKICNRNTHVVLFVFVQSILACSSQKQLIAKRPTDPRYLSIQWNQATLRKVADGGYARMVELTNGKLITVYNASNGNTEIVTSSDKGDHWSVPVIVAAKANDIRMDAPDITLLSDGSLLVCYNPRPSGRNTDTSKHFGIRVAKSFDEGRTWADDKLIYQAGSIFKDGCWEPAAIQLPSGELQLYFSDEGIYTASNEQNISMLRSLDNGKTWTAKPEIVSFRKDSRDGMPVPVYLPKTKQVVFSIEDNGYVNFKPYTIRSAANGTWPKTIDSNSPLRSYALKDSLDEKVYAGAPYLRILSNGNTILSYQSTQFRQSLHDVKNAEMVVVVGNEKAKNFTNPTVPFIIAEGKTGLWNSITVLKDDTIIALTSTNGYGNKGEVWMILGKLVNK